MPSSPRTPRQRRGPVVEDEPASPVFEPPQRSDTFDEDSKTTYESSQEDNDDAPTSILSNDPFSSESSRILFESIDELRRCGAGQDLDLPQLVIVGKQSAGKSSLLKSLTDIPFPIDSNLCTQFAMRIVSRRTAPGTSDIVQASIEPGDVNPFTVHSDDSRAKAFSKVLASLDFEAFEELIVEAKEAMGIGSPLSSEDKNYSSQVLKIELSGPKRSHFAILDLPGIFSSRRDGVSRREMEGVTRMVTSYMQKPENIIICVADASGDIQNEQILELASEIESSRKVGVFTKCDKSDNPKDIVNLVNGRNKFQGKPLHWHVVQNAGPNAAANFDREQAEAATFTKSPWTEIPKERRGIPALKQYLATLLCTRIREAFPDMLRTVTGKLDEEQLHRRSLGESRADHSQRLAHLVAISQKYQDLAKKSLSTPDALPDAKMKLRGKSKAITQEYTKSMTTNGHFYNFLEIGKSVDVFINVDEESDSSSESLPVPDFGHTRGSKNDLPTPISTPTKKSTAKTQFKTAVHPLYREIRTQLRENLGEELPGVLNPCVLHPLWRIQTQKWQSLTRDHLSKLITRTSEVSILLFRQACKEVGVSERTVFGLEKQLAGFERQSRQDVMNKLDLLCTRNANMALQTNNPEFDYKVRKARELRFSQALERYIALHPPSTFSFAKLTTSKPCAIVDDDHIATLFNELHPNGARSQNVEDEIHDLLRAYYEITIQNFIYDVTHNLSEPFLLDTNGPLLGLNTEFVMGLGEDVVLELAGDEEVDVVKRRECEGRIGRLEEASA
ncbi:P-loop containing nucleoside triphosphate hydrolase [Glarea lozoyensis ATCC 20868]|uniref:p-loop containing nucleoside triphosphate hydrolase n=1 Tax=Glarea lozoyensis (strain ATCC 20868 / MF5171) TaxID=1116229 RepID=S3DA84_GLAL2|nr:P-loop containing nucleoside triphosphate hydrolase [Glarea lozoyensis ATCC 20868]EPE35352.1 P-loop containing nucleoside triphosphate hydrolase [Glarea lozoyensis ATCC 20868]